MFTRLSRKEGNFGSLVMVMLVILFIKIVRNYRLGRSVCGSHVDWSRFLRHMMLFLRSTSTVGKGSIMGFGVIP